MPLHPARLWSYLSTMKRFGLFTTVAMLLCCPIASAQQPTQPTGNQSVAVVNADPITHDALADATLMRYGTDVMDNMINRHLILQACKDAGFEITPEHVREEIARLASKFNLPIESYLKLLSDERDISPDRYSREIVWPMLALRKLVADRVQPTKEEFNRALISQYGEAIKCRMIMVGDEATANSLHAQATASPDQFGNLAKKYSKDEASASVGGLIPPIRRYTSDTRLEEAAFALRDNEVSKVLPLGDQWILLQAVRRIPATPPKPIAMPRIKQRIEDQIRDQKMRGAATKLFEELQTKAQVVKVFGNPAMEQKYPGLAAVVNGTQVTVASLAAECVKAHGHDVLEGEINRKLLTQALRKAGLQVTQADIRAEVERAAISFGIVRADGTADLDAWIKSVTSDGETTEEIYVSDSVWPSVALKKLVEDKIQITQEDLQKGFQSNYGERVEVLAIVLADQRTAQKVWEMARDNPTEQFFRELAQQYSVEPVSASNSGKVPPIRKYGGQPSIENEAFGMKPGELSGIVATGDKYILLRCQGHTQPIVKELATVQEELVRDLREKKLAVAMASKFDELKETASIDNFMELQKKAPVAAAPGTQQSLVRPASAQLPRQQ